MALSKSAKYYRDNPEAREKKNNYNLIFQRRKKQVKKRVECNKYNRDKGTYGNGDNKDCSHQSDGSLKTENQSTNRARGGGQRR
jgi:hypothetical protein|tara:strand:+ start:3053 stop:3304 length:252 start_codon:yes stop_codon:yes gene_type:complete